MDDSYIYIKDIMKKKKKATRTRLNKKKGTP